MSFISYAFAQQYITEGGIGYAKDILESCGHRKTMEILNKLTVSLQVRPSTLSGRLILHRC